MSKSKTVRLVRPPMKGYTVGQLEDNVFAPIGLYLLASVLRKRFPGIDVKVVDGYNKSNDQTIAEIGNPDIVGVTCGYWNYDNALPILEYSKSKGAQTVIGGPNMTHLARRTLTNRDFIDFAVVNDGEEALPAIVEGVAGKNTPNLFYRDGNNVLESLVRRNSPLDTLFTLEDMSAEEMEKLKGHSVPVAGIRGCAKAEKEGPCDFCSICHPLSEMEQDLIWQQARILKSYGFRYLWEVGETVFQSYLQKLLRTRPVDLEDIQWKFYICADLVNEDVAELLRDLGTKEVQIGIETPNDEILQNVGKKARLDDIIRAVDLVSSHGIDIHATAMYGLTGETPESAKRTYEFIRSLVAQYPQIKKITTSHALPFFGNKMFRRLAKNPEYAKEYPGDLNKDDSFDYRALTRIYTKHFTSVDFDQMETLVQKTRALMDGRGYGTSFDLVN